MIAVAGGKGGSGKTTTTLGLARALSRRGAPVVAADADWDLPNLARLAAETNPESPTATGAEDSVPADRHTDGTGARTVLDAVRGTEPVRPGRSSPAVLAGPDAPRSVDASAALDALDGATPDGAPVLLDSPAGASPDVAAPLRAADRALITTPLRRAALRDAAKTAAIARRLDCPPVGAVVVGETSVPDRVATLLDCPVLGAIPDGGAAPLSDPSVRSAYDDLAARLGETAAASGWQIA
ncbi:cell division inhibitor MinD-like (chromosome partitioning ATPase) [Halorubrum californiense DSM 19288]|uniref:Cell division inhibitor MinD-like (Chromosome partitioning ATPase) n=1 Tax=Halorubrum californiense DSM 19288 TaxID=1227465 RepID=M0DX54_9EURY|nr:MULTISPECIES: P-loop NTPase [Halorubrum]ELZ40061.1 cell division inhibitor MinD-like (chromosome partitioning ATPase) [Halorubrum californiense DSM 19288]TKX73218.1 cell division inhibitor MinD [Halorubrum sp. GN11GM_10-3_MGM]